MNTALVLAGLFLIFEPEISFIDFLPDFIGFLLILRGIGRLGAVSPSAEDSARLFRRAGLCSAIRLAALLPMLSVTSSDPAFNMIFTLVFGIAQTLFVIPAFARLGDSVEWFASVSGRQSRKSGKMAVCAAVLFIQKYVFALLPQLVYLEVEELDLFEGSVYPLAGYKNPLIIICFSVSLFAGIACLIILTRFFGRLGRDAAFQKDVNAMISAAPVPENELKLKAVKTFAVLLICAVWTGFPLEIDGSRLIPVVIPAFLAMAAVLSAGKALVLTRATKTAAVFFAAISVPVFGILTWFATLYNDYASANIKRMIGKFVPAIVACVVFLAVFAVFAITVRRLIGRLISLHTGVLWENPYITHNASVQRERTGLYNRFNLCTALALALLPAGGITFALKYSVDWIRLPYMAFYLLFAVLCTSSLLALQTMCAEKYSEKTSD